jgi:hypothetical protein
MPTKNLVFIILLNSSLGSLVQEGVKLSAPLTSYGSSLDV